MVGALPAYCYFGADVGAASVSDVALRRVPNRAVLPAYLVGPALLALASAASGPWWPLARRGIAMALLAGFYLILGLGFPTGMGLGDPLTELRRETTFVGMPDDPPGRRATIKPTDRS